MFGLRDYAELPQIPSLVARVSEAFHAQNHTIALAVA